LNLGLESDDDDEGEDDDDDESDEAAEAEEDQDEDDMEDEDPHAPPALLITTSMPSNSTSPHLSSANARSHPAERVRQFVDELLNIFPGAEYRPRAKARGVGLGKIANWARTRGYGGMLVVGEDKKEPFSLTVIGLPRGPTAFFRLTSIAMGKEIYGHARPTPHTPELILNNFTTTLGHQVGSLLQSLFPKIPQLEGRQVFTAHNQRDYIFFRRHRYMFKSDEKAKLQEIGPKFTLKLRSLKKGLPKGAGVWDGEIHFDGKDNADEVDKDAEEGGQDGDIVGGESVLTKQRKGAKTSHRLDETVEGYDFEWRVSISVSNANVFGSLRRFMLRSFPLPLQPKMGVSRRNFYL
jgi:ribosome production factor 1